MANPMGNMTFKCQAAAAKNQSDKVNFTSALSKVGNLNILNSVGLGSIGSGLRTLVSASNSINTGCGTLPSSIGASLESGVNWVLGAVGIPASAIAAVNNINPQMANLAQGQAMQIYNKVANGNFKLSDIPGSIADLQNLEKLANGIYPIPGIGSNAVSVECIDSAYARDIAANAPKFKFLFIVQFVFADPYNKLHDFAFMVKKSTRPTTKFTTEDVNYYNFRTKVTTKTEFEEMTMSFHDDNANNTMNFYNAYRNAISPVTNLDENTFFTATTEQGMDFTSTVSNATGPTKATTQSTTTPLIPVLPAIPPSIGGVGVPAIETINGFASVPNPVSTQLGTSSIPGLISPINIAGPTISGVSGLQSMAPSIPGSTTTTTSRALPPTGPGIPVNKYTASRGPLANDNLGVITQIKLFHIYDYGQKTNVYQFFNPRITSLDLDDLDMSAGSECNELTLKFNYDTVYIQTDVSLKSDSTGVTNSNVMPNQAGARYPLRYNGTAGAMDSAHTSQLASATQPAACGINQTNTAGAAGTSAIQAASAALNNVGSSISSGISKLFG
jgi:hypothetical protein